jgi:2-(1,2-epoxy-1,2-dihydrophenyl)acetyl-CoA isomerase
MSIVRFEMHDGIATVTLNRPESLNSMSDDLMSGLAESFARVESNEAVCVVILTGAGRGFGSGADLSALDNGETGRANGDSIARIFNPAIRAITNCAVSTVGRINEVAAGGGLGFAMACDISIAARSAFFVATFRLRLGIIPDMGASWHLPLRAGAARARGIAKLGERITAYQAAESGLFWDAVEDDQCRWDEKASLPHRSIVRSPSTQRAH